MIRVNILDYNMADSRSLEVPFDNCSIDFILQVVDGQIQGNWTVWDLAITNPVNLRFLPNANACKVFASSGNPEILKNAFQKGDVIDLSGVFPPEGVVKIGFTEYLPEKQCNCNH